MLVAAPITVGLGACEFPTELPKWDTTWVVPGENTSIGVRDLLPSSVSVSGNAFVANLQPASFSRTLGEMCGTLCTAAEGQTVPKPPFDVTFSSTFSLPSDVLSATLADNRLDFQLSHNLGFDPIRPGAGSVGSITLTLSIGSSQVSSTVISGTTTSFPSGSTLVASLPVPAGSSAVSGPITLRVDINSPAGDPVRIDTSSRITFTPSPIRVTEARVQVANRQVAAQQAQFDLDIDRGIATRVKAGALILDLENPFSVSGNLTLTVRTPNVVIQKPIQLQPGASMVRVPFDRGEIQAILLHDPVQLSVTGAVNAPAAGTVVRPNQVVNLRSRLEFTFGPEED